MTMQFLELGPTPTNEECVQVGDKDYSTVAYQECVRYRAQLERQFGVPPEGGKFGIKKFDHDLGYYYEVVIYYNDNYPDSIEFAYNLDENLPENWDD